MRSSTYRYDLVISVLNRILLLTRGRLAVCRRKHRLPRRFLEKKSLWLSFGVALLALIAMVAATEVYCRRYEDWSTAGGEMVFWRLRFLVAGAMYLQAKALFPPLSAASFAARALSLLGSCSFGVYLIQHWLLSLSQDLTAGLARVLGLYPAAVCQALAVCLAGTGITFVLKQIPGIKRLL